MNTSFPSLSIFPSFLIYQTHTLFPFSHPTLSLFSTPTQSTLFINLSNCCPTLPHCYCYSFKSSPLFPNVIPKITIILLQVPETYIINLNKLPISVLSVVLFPVPTTTPWSEQKMENQFFLASGVSQTQQHPLHFEPSPPNPSSVPSWQSLSPPNMGIQLTVMNCAPEQTQDCFYNPNWDKSTADHGLHHFDSSALSSMVSSPAA